jgi:hypothetical protein
MFPKGAVQHRSSGTTLQAFADQIVRKTVSRCVTSGIRWTGIRSLKELHAKLRTTRCAEAEE